MPQAQAKKPFLQSFQNSSLVVYGQYIFKAWCLVTNDNCKVKKQPNSKIRQHQQRYKVKTLWIEDSPLLQLLILEQLNNFKFFSFSLLYFLFFLKTKTALGWKGRELNTVKLSLLMHRFTGVVINMQYVER